jgi:hypothetical protein
MATRAEVPAEQGTGPFRFRLDPRLPWPTLDPKIANARGYPGTSYLRAVEVSGVIGRGEHHSAAADQGLRHFLLTLVVDSQR